MSVHPSPEGNFVYSPLLKERGWPTTLQVEDSLRGEGNRSFRFMQEAGLWNGWKINRLVNI
jgi:hypothetical protein